QRTKASGKVARMRTLKLLLFVIAFTACRTSPSISDDPAPSPRSTALDAAHAAYLQGNFLAMAQRIRDVLTDVKADPLARENALGLLEKAYEEQDGKLPADWKLPRGFEVIRYHELRASEVDGVRYSIALMGLIDDASRITSMELRRWPDE